MPDEQPEHWTVPTFRSLTARPMLGGLPPEWAIALGAMWWAAYIVTASPVGCAIGCAVCWGGLALVLHHDPHSIEILRRALQLRKLLEG